MLGTLALLALVPGYCLEAQLNTDIKSGDIHKGPLVLQWRHSEESWQGKQSSEKSRNISGESEEHALEISKAQNTKLTSDTKMDSAPSQSP